MSLLTTTRLAPLLDRLFSEASYWPEDDSVLALSEDEQTRLMRSKTEYREFYGQLRERSLPVSRDTAHWLYLLTRTSKARSIVEFGTSFGVSTLHLAAGLRDNGGGHLITSEFEPGKVLKAQANLKAAGLADLVEIRQGDALQTLSSDLPKAIDLVLLDGAKGLYLDVLLALEYRLAPGALVIADDANYCPEYLAHVRDPASGYLSIALRDDVEVSMSLG